MKTASRILSLIVCTVVIAACAGPNASNTAASSPENAGVCKVGGIECRWDNQCCSGRCYVDTGCSG
jgi:hypothetical protein